MPERLKQRQDDAKPRFWDRFRKEGKGNAPQSVRTARPEKAKTESATKKPRGKEAAKSKLLPPSRPKSPVPTQRAAPSRRPIETVLYGVGKAVTHVPEKQGEWLLRIYNKHIYPKLTPEQQKKAKQWEPKIKKAAKVGGWVMTGAEVIIAGVIVKKLYRSVRQRFSKPLTVTTESGLMDKKTQKAAKQAEDALPGWFRDGLSSLQQELDRNLPKELEEKKSVIIQHALHDIGQLAAQGMPSDVSEMMTRVRVEPDKDVRRKLSIEAFFAWNESLEKAHKHPLEMRQIMGLVMTLQSVGFDKLTFLDPSKLSRLRPDSVLSALDAMFPLISGGSIPESVQKAMRVADEFFRTLGPEDGPIPANPEESITEVFRPLIKLFYMHLIGQKKVVGEIHGLPNRDAQMERLGGEFERFSEAYLNKEARGQRDMNPEQLKNARNNINMMGGMLGLFGYPGIEEIGIQLKKNSSE